MSIYEKFLDFCKNNDLVLAIYLEGSRVYAKEFIDDYSDYDFLVLVSDIKPFVEDEKFLYNFGEILIMQKPSDSYYQPYDYSGKEPFTYLVQFKGKERLDINFVDISNYQEYVDKYEPIEEIYNKDKIEYISISDNSNVFNITKPTEKEYFDCVNEFYWISLYVAKALNRQELINAIKIYKDYYLKMFMKMLSFKIGHKNDYKISLGKNYRFIKNYLSSWEYKDVVSLYYIANKDDLYSKIFITMDKFTVISREVSNLLGFKFTDYSQVRSFLIEEYLIKE